MDGMEQNTGEANGSEQAGKGKPRKALWKRILKWMGLVILALYAIGVLCNLWIIHTWKRDKTDYLAELNKIGWKDLPAEQNAWTYYAKAMELYVEMPKECDEYFSKSDRCSEAVRYWDLSGDIKQKMDEWIEANETCLAEAEKGSQLEYCWQPAAGFMPALDDSEIKDLMQLRAISRLIPWRVEQRTQRGQFAEALGDVISLSRIGCHLMHEKTMLFYLVGRSILSLSEETLLTIMKEYSIPSDLLTITQNEFAKLLSNGYPRINLHAEKVFWMGSMKHAVLTNWEKRAFVPFVFLTFETFDDFIHNTERCFSDLDAYHNTFSFRTKDSFEEMNPEFTIHISKRLLAFQKRTFQSIIRTRQKHIAEYEAALTVLAMKRWKMEKGSYPATLKELVEGGVLAKEPSDPYAEGALRYERRGEDFILYSVGADFMDNGGVEDQENPWGEAGKIGDRVFWGGTSPEGSAGEKNGEN